MPATADLRIPVDAGELETVRRLAGEIGIAAYVRKALGLPPRKPGRPPKVGGGGAGGKSKGKP